MTMKIPRPWVRLSFCLIPLLTLCVFIYVIVVWLPGRASPNSENQDLETSVGFMVIKDFPERESNFLFKAVSDTHYTDLITTVTPPIVHFVWCRKQFFEFKHYLSVLSAYKVLRPDKIYFHYAADPMIDLHRYHLWINNLKKELPCLVFKAIPSCGKDTVARINVVLGILHKHGGTYINETLILTENMQQLRYKEYAMFGLADGSGRRQNYLLNGLLKSPRNPQEGLRIDSSIKHWCTLPEQMKVISDKYRCVSLSKMSLFPHEIWEGNTAFQETVRLILFGKKQPMVAVPDMNDKLPLLAHYVWMEGLEVTFLAYLSIMSTINILKVDAVFLHGNKEPTGELWKVVKNHSKVHFVYRELPEYIYDNYIHDLPHVSDILRVDILLKYGGIYTDWDAVWVKPIDDLRGYDAVVSLDWPDWHPPWPDKINAGVLLAKKNSKFLYYVQETMKTYDHKGDWYYQGLLQPYRVAERHPDTVRIDRHLQVICFEYKCHPVWKPGYKNASIHHLNGAPFNWRSDVYAVHWTRPDPLEFKSEEALRNSNTMFAEIGKHVLGIE